MEWSQSGLGYVLGQQSQEWGSLSRLTLTPHTLELQGLAFALLGFQSCFGSVLLHYAFIRPSGMGNAIDTGSHGDF